MIDLTQLLLVVVVTVLTSLLTIIGIQVYYILKEFRKTIEKSNKILDDGGVISESVAKPAQSFSGLIMGIKSGLDIFSSLKKSQENIKEIKRSNQEVD